ncbi:FAD-dependent monooxygenase [Dactylosporangium sp. NPDC000244]|uniref:FAD-dependent monooxygenase n=1 Tax=Dactylosporangium sp. NPDC000244 TaxID=3154365 RepID=UPI00331E72E6
MLPIPQHRLERLPAERAVRLGVMVLRGRDVSGFEQDGNGVTVQAAAEDSPVELRAWYLVGCDGAQSA